MKRATTPTTAKTRRESNEKTGRKPLCDKILGVMVVKGIPVTAREIAVELHKNGIVEYPYRQAVQPRLTEMVIDGDVVVAGKVFDETSKRNVAAYKLPQKG